MRVLILFSTVLWGIMTSAFAGKSGADLTESDIEKSNARIQKAFHSQKKENSILEQNIPVGEVSFENDSFFVTFRPSLGMEVLNCIDNTLYPLNQIGLNIEGNGHKGLTQRFSPQNIKDNVVNSFIEYKKKTQIPTEQATIIVEGFSAGAHRAIETATYLKQHADTKNHNVVVLRYAGANTFDDTAVNNIHKLLDKTNIIDFHAKGDKIAAILNMPGVTTSLGNQIEFSAENSENFNKRVKNKAYTNLDPTVGFFIKALYNPAVWELHQPITYAELSPKTFAEFKKK